VSCILKRILECLTKNYLAKKEGELSTQKNLKLNVRSVRVEFMHRLHNFSALSLASSKSKEGKLHEKQVDVFCARFFFMMTENSYSLFLFFVICCFFTAFFGNEKHVQ
jgi:hypothetical protein